MSAESNHDKPSDQDVNFDAHDVIAVLEDEGRPPQVIEQHFQLRARYASHASVVFRLFPVTDSTSTMPTSFLQIKAGDIKSLEKEVYGKANPNSPGPAYLDVVRKLLNGMHSVACLRFQLRSRGIIDLIKPSDSSSGNIPVNPVLDTCTSLQSLALTSLFSIYFRHDILRRKTIKKYTWAIAQFPHLTETEKQSYKCMVDVRRLYHGAGGRVHTCDDHGSPPTRDRLTSPAPGTPASCGSGSTLPFDEVPPCRGHRASPPPYDECVGEEQSPGAGSDAPAALFATGPESGCCDPPKYGDTERRDDALDPLQGTLPCGTKDTNIRSVTKRKRPISTMCTITTVATDAPRPEKLQRFLFANLDETQMANLHGLQHEQTSLQGQQTEQLQESVRQLRKTVEELEKRVDRLQRWKEKHKKLHGDLEGTCSQLVERQNDVDTAIDNLSCDVDELGGKHDELGKQMLDVGDEVKDLMEDMGRTAKEDIRKIIDDGVAKAIEEIVEARVNEVKRRITEALLQPI
ncbi:hypothetical protein CGRA01v4_15054 [Colletotrichum graminicola]|uniref:Uncharacterized protein n=1 Tax=Colletotrichum graminicola (strain M1.001 / M2 / FGSC 10212) TaxID=645133 RepID=E3R058_COLGM|nr:uncharacterized protein GLRG_11641 [Colletotrichum graminicola M1.001]EFQ36496.1 hypothetical protein GLRG_11641 [Colletotrichum graminicola M1.001]WDK23762.1 hypothetical protein CGRA01v4_15054 [Colletotrichum graminicola]